MSERKIAPVLALDIGNVAIHIDPVPLLNLMGFESMEAFRKYDDDNTIWNGCMAFEEGTFCEEEFANWFSTATPRPIAVNDVRHVWGILLKNEVDGIAEVVQLAVDNGVKPVFMSDICPVRYEMSCDLLSFTHLMAGAVLSYEVGRHKPHEAMYAAMEPQFCDGGVPLLYADDLLQNIAAAKERGWAAYQFGNWADLNQLLRERLELLR